MIYTSNGAKLSKLVQDTTGQQTHCAVDQFYVIQTAPGNAGFGSTSVGMVTVQCCMEPRYLRSVAFVP